MTTTINQVSVCNLVDVLKKGLCSGKGKGTPGDLCVMQAVRLVFDGDGSDDSASCVGMAPRALEIGLNDAFGWASQKSRAAGLKNLAIASLGTAKNFDNVFFACKMAMHAVNVNVPLALRAAALMLSGLPEHQKCLEEHAINCTSATEPNAAAARAADAAADAAAAARAADAAADAAAAADDAAAARAAAEQVLIDTAKYAVSVLVEMKTPGSEFLDLTC